jgi:Glutaredoxin-like domain (DUF836)
MSPSTAIPVPTVAFYTRPGCHLCADGRQTLHAILEERAIAGRRPCRVEERVLTDDPAWERRYLERIPVLAVGDEELSLSTSAQAIRAFLARALDAPIA